MRKWLLKWLGAMDQKDGIDLSKLMVQQSLINDNFNKMIDNLKMSQTLGFYKYELILKHGCFDCFSVDGEWHKDECRQAHDKDGNRQLVRRDNGRKPVGHS